MIEYVTRDGEILKTSPKWRVQTSDRVIINGDVYYVYRTKDCQKYIKAFVIREAMDG